MHACGDSRGLSNGVAGQISQGPNAFIHKINPAKAHVFSSMAEYLCATWAVNVNQGPFWSRLIDRASIHVDRAIAITVQGQRRPLQTGWWRTDVRAELTDDDSISRRRWVRLSDLSWPHRSTTPFQVGRVDIRISKQFGGLRNDTRTVRHPKRQGKRTPVIAAIRERD